MCSRYAEAQCCICHRNFSQSNNNRIIVEICGHQKCRECFIQEENGCSVCATKTVDENGVGDSVSAVPSSSNGAPIDATDGREECGIDSALTAEVIQDASHIITTTEQGDGTTRYKCTICQKSFKSRNNCKYHLFCDKSRAKPFKCNQCDKQFITLAHMNYHRQSTHNVEKQFPCTHCKKIYSGEIALKKHMKKHQSKHILRLTDLAQSCEFDVRFIFFSFTDDYNYQCSQCSEKFLYKEQLNIHQNRHNNIFHKCPECGKHFLIKSNLTKHIQSHTGTCIPIRNNKTVDGLYVLSLLPILFFVNSRCQSKNLFNL